MSTRAMVFDISMPVRGQAEFLPTALNSIAAQQAEVRLAFLDATPDNSVQQVLTSYSDLPLKYARHGSDSGQAAAIQEGWNHLQGDVVHWLNADDMLVPDALSFVEQVFRSQRDLDVVYGDALFVSPDGSFRSYFPAISDNAADLFRGCCISQPACFVRRSVVEKIGGLNQELHFVMDWDLWTRLHVAGAKFFYLHRPLAAVRIYPGTKTSAGGSARLREIWWHLQKYTGLGGQFRSMLGFLAESGGEKPLFWERALKGLLDGYRNGRIAFNGILSAEPPKTLYGIEVHRNRVREVATVWLPYYQAPVTSLIEVTAKGTPGLEVKVKVNDAIATPVGTEWLARGVGKFTFAVPPVAEGVQLYEIRLCSAARNPWILQSARIS